VNNEQFVEALQAFAESRRPEYLSRGPASSLDSMTAEQKAQAEELRRQAIALAASVAGSSDPLAWAILSRGTRFDDYRAKVARGEIVADGSTADLMAYVTSRGALNIDALNNPHLEDFLSGQDIHEAQYQASRSYHETVWGHNPDARFMSFEAYARMHGWNVPEPVTA